MKCPHCGNEDMRLIEILPYGWLLCTVCSKQFRAKDIIQEIPNPYNDIRGKE